MTSEDSSNIATPSSPQKRASSNNHSSQQQQNHHHNSYIHSNNGLLKRRREDQETNGHFSNGFSIGEKRRSSYDEVEAVSTVEKRAMKNSKVNPEGRHVCGECGRTLVSQWGLDAHIKTVHGAKTFKCEFCDKAFGRRDHLVNHTNSIHTGSKECAQCGAICRGKEGLVKHIKEAHPAAPPTHPCNVCGRKFPTEENLKIHYQQIHAEIKCADCHMLCVGTEGLKNHVKTFHQQQHQVPSQPLQQHHLHNGSSVNGISSGDKKSCYKCSYCSGTFLQRTTLEKHTESFHLEVQCGFCYSAFVGTENMSEHVKESHPADKIVYNDTEMCFHCEGCDASFRRKTAYDEHFLRAHVFRKVGQDFVRAQVLEQRNEDHLGVLFRCSHCHGRFSHQSLLNQHLAMAHSTKILATTAVAGRPTHVVSAAGDTYESLVIDSVALDKHSIERQTLAGVGADGDLQEDIISNSLNVLYQF